MFNKRAKSKPANRSRRLSDDEDGPSTSGEMSGVMSRATTADGSPSTLAAKLKDKVKKSRPKSRLSFGGTEEEGETDDAFQVKRSKLSQKLTLGKSSKHSQDALPMLEGLSASKHGPIYDSAYIDELKASTRRAPAPDPYDADMSMEVSLDVGDTTMSLVDDDVSASNIIPSESSIKVAKERRERTRKLAEEGHEDFISLSLTTRVADQGPHPESRLVREEDEYGEGEDDFAEYTSAQERIALGKKSRKAEAQTRRDAMQELIADAEEVDDETMEWEQEQLRRGGHLSSTSTPDSSKVKQTYKAAPIPPVTTIPSLNSAIDRLSHQLAQMTTSHASNISSMNSLSQERDELDKREREMRDMVSRAEEKRAWFVSFNEWIESVAGFLDEKYPMLEKIEAEYVSLLEERYAMVKTRRTDDDRDDLSLFFGNVSTAHEPSEEKDEFGRSKPTAAELVSNRRALRAARRQQRNQQREVDEGFSTDAELPIPDEAAYHQALETLESNRKEILSDVKAKEFLDPSKGMWGTWRERYNDSYVGAWGGLGVVSVWEFWARLESVGWNCVESSRSLDTFHWYKGLYDYSRPDGEELGTDGDLVASMITTVIIPRICEVIEGGALDVYSEKHIKRMVDLTEEIEASVTSGGSKIQILFTAIHRLFDQAIAETEALQIEPLHTQSATSFNPESVPARRRYLNRRVKLLRNMLRWQKYTGERFGIDHSIQTLVDRILLPVADSGWEVGGMEVMRQVLDMLPAELVTSALKARFKGQG